MTLYTIKKGQPEVSPSAYLPHPETLETGSLGCPLFPSAAPASSQSHGCTA